jgi:hypothetical protein
MLKKILIAAALMVTTMQAADRVFELRTYTTNEGKLPDLLKRFREHTTQIFEKHGMTNIGYWVPKDKPNTLIYVLAYRSREDAKKAWEDFRADPEWQKVSKASEENGKIVTHVESVFMDPADFSSIK